MLGMIYTLEPMGGVKTTLENYSIIIATNERFQIGTINNYANFSEINIIIYDFIQEVKISETQNRRQLACLQVAIPMRPNEL